MRTFVKNAAVAVTSISDTSAEVVREAVRALDKAAQKGIIHRNAAARRKSRLMARLHALSLAEKPAAASTTGGKATTAKKPAAAKRTTTTRKAAAEKKTTTAKKPAARKTTKAEK